MTKSKLGHQEDAIRDYDEAIRTRPKFAEAFCYRGLAKSILGQHKEAIVDYDCSIRLGATSPEVYLGRGSAKANLGKNDEARSDFETALEIAEKEGNESLIAALKANINELGRAEST